CGSTCSITAGAGTATCSSSICSRSCASSESLCGTGCYSLSSDSNNCGSCGNVCPNITGGCCVNNGFGQQTVDCNICGLAGYNCFACNLGQRACGNGVCGPCPAGQNLCGSACRDLTSDNNNCGACGNACNTSIGLACFNSQCLGTTGA